MPLLTGIATLPDGSFIKVQKPCSALTMVELRSMRLTSSLQIVVTGVRTFNSGQLQFSVTITVTVIDFCLQGLTAELEVKVKV